MTSQSALKQLQARPKAQTISIHLSVTARRPVLARKQAFQQSQRASVKAAAAAEGRARSDGNIGGGNARGGWFSGRDAPLTPDATVDLPPLTGVSEYRGGGSLLDALGCSMWCIGMHGSPAVQGLSQLADHLLSCGFLRPCFTESLRMCHAD